MAGLTLDVPTANAHIGRWLDEEERLVLLPLPIQAQAPAPAPSLRAGRVVPRESFQHPLSVYQDLLA